MDKNLSFRFNLSATAVITLILTLFGVYEYLSTSNSLNSQLDADIARSADRLQITLPASIWNYEIEQVNVILESTLQSPYVEAVLVFEGAKWIAGLSKVDGNITETKEFAWDGKISEHLLQFDDAGTLNEVGVARIFINDEAVQSKLLAAIWLAVLKIVVLDILMIAALTTLISRLVTSPITKVNEALKEIASGEGDMTKRIEVTSRDEIGQLGIHFNTFIEKVHGIIQRVLTSTHNINGAIEVMSSSASDSSQSVEQQQSETKQVVIAIDQMSQTCQVIAENANSASKVAVSANAEVEATHSLIESAKTSTRSLTDEMHNSSRVINSLQHDVTDIVKVLEVIRGIADQTNLLALNAAIEAARAGEQGRGFAVVADEVRALASRTQDSTKEIQEMIERLNVGSKEAVATMEKSHSAGDATVELVHKAVDSLNQITHSIELMNKMNAEIANASEEQSSVAEEINTNISNLSELTHTSASSTQKTAQASKDLSTDSNSLAELVSQFKV